MNKVLDLSKILSNYNIYVSAPGRIDCGGTLDIKALALLIERYSPSTVNISVDLRTTISLFPYDFPKVCISKNGVVIQTLFTDKVNFNSEFGLIFAILAYFNVAGVRIDIQSEIPLKSGLGGSSALSVALIAGLSKALSLMRIQPELNKDHIAFLAHNIEDGLRFSYTGLQDQLASVYGGINKWVWSYGLIKRPYKRIKLIERKSFSDIEKCILIAYTGVVRESSGLSKRYVDSFLLGKYHKYWQEILTQTNEFSQYLSLQDWTKAGLALNKESSIREKIIPEIRTDFYLKLKDAAISENCGAATTGGNLPGCIWALGEPSSILQLKQKWNNIFVNSKEGRLIIAPVSRSGILIDIHPKNNNI